MTQIEAKRGVDYVVLADNLSPEDVGFVEEARLRKAMRAILNGHEYLMLERMLFRRPSPSHGLPSIDWATVPDHLNWLVKTPDNRGFLYDLEPFLRRDSWLICSPGRPPTGVDGNTSYNPGTCDWKDSLVMRPAYRGK